MNPLRWLAPQRTASVPQALADACGFPWLEGAARFEIDLRNGWLGVADPASNLTPADYWKGCARDRRPFVNARSGAEFSESPLTGRYSCILYETGWALPLDAEPTRRKAVLKFTLLLERPARVERDTFPDLTDDGQLSSWLTRCYRDRKQSFDQMAVDVLSDGTLAIDERPHEQRICHEDELPLQTLDQPVCGHTAYRIFMHPGVIEYSLSRNPKEIVQLRFQLSPQGIEPLSEAIKQNTQAFSLSVLQSLTLSEKPRTKAQLDAS